MTIDPRVIDARNLVEIKRAKLMTSVKYGVGEAKRRLAPDLVADHVWEVTKDKARRAADDMVLAAKDKPWIVAAIGAGIGMIFARGQIGDLVRDGAEKLRARFEEEEDAADDAPNENTEEVT